MTLHPDKWLQTQVNCFDWLLSWSKHTKSFWKVETDSKHSAKCPTVPEKQRSGKVRVLSVSRLSPSSSCYSARACFYAQAKEQSHVEKKTGKNARLWKRRRRGICQRGQRAATRLPNMMSGSQAVTAKTACLNTLSSVLFNAPHRHL